MKGANMQAPVTLNQIDTKARAYSDARDRLRELCAALEDGMKALRQEHLPGIRRALNRAAEAEAALEALVEQAPELFVKPKTVILHGIRVGFVKSKGKIEFSDADRVVALIKKHFPDQADVLIATTEKPVKDALNGLTAADLRKLGINVVEGDDAVYIKPADSALDKMVDALLKAATEEARA